MFWKYSTVVAFWNVLQVTSNWRLKVIWQGHFVEFLVKTQTWRKRLKFDLFWCHASMCFSVLLWGGYLEQWFCGCNMWVKILTAIWGHLFYVQFTEAKGTFLLRANHGADLFTVLLWIGLSPVLDCVACVDDQCFYNFKLWFNSKSEFWLMWQDKKQKRGH